MITAIQAALINNYLHCFGGFLTITVYLLLLSSQSLWVSGVSSRFESLRSGLWSDLDPGVTLRVIVEASKLEHHSPPALKVKYKGSQH